MQSLSALDVVLESVQLHEILLFQVVFALAIVLYLLFLLLIIILVLRLEFAVYQAIYGDATTPAFPRLEHVFIVGSGRMFY